MSLIDPDLPEPSLDDAALPAAIVDLNVPLNSRWPEPRLLHQTQMWFERDSKPVWLRFAEPPRLALILARVRRMTPVLYRRAAEDERLATSSAMRLAESELGIPRIEDLDPHVWVESTELVRWLRAYS